MSDRDNEYRRFFHRATGLDPYPYQVRLACGQDWPLVVTAPTGAGKTAAVILGWLWRHGQTGRLNWDMPGAGPPVGSAPSGSEVPGGTGIPGSDSSRHPEQGRKGLLARALGAITGSLAHLAGEPEGLDIPKSQTGPRGTIETNQKVHGPGSLSGQGDGQRPMGLQGWPTRLVYCLPMRTLVDQTWRNAIQWLHALGLLDGDAEFDSSGRVIAYRPAAVPAGTGKVSVHLLMGGELDRDWDRRPEALSILVGTQDMLLSRALNRGFATSRFRWPLQFGLINNDVLWVLDEVQLMGNGLPTSLQLQAFRRDMGTYGPALTTWMSATLDRQWLQTRDFDPHGDRAAALSIGPADRAAPALKKRLEAGKPVFRRKIAAWTKGDKKTRQGEADSLAQWIVGEHRPASRTLVVLNTVGRARLLHETLRRTPGLEADLVLLHSRFRPADRSVLFDRLLAEPGEAGTIAVTTQVVEAGIDVSAELLITDLAPWSSMVQRFGRCNRSGTQPEARIFWLDPEELTDKEAAPYDFEALERARAILDGLEDAAPASLPEQSEPQDHLLQLRRRDLIGLFDTTPDLTGADIDVSPFVRGGDERNLSVFWRDFDGNPTASMPRPSRDELCSVSLQDLANWIDKNTAWRWDHVDGQWRRLWKGQRIPPGSIVLVRASDGGYVPELGWTGTKAKKNQSVPVVGAGAAPPLDAHDRDYRTVGSGRGRWQTLAQHTDAVFSALEDLINQLPVADLPAQTMLLAARWHDAGKAHPVFQRALASCGPPDESEIWAKAQGGFARYERPGFRHELASAAAMLAQDIDFLAVYLAAAHHGKVRLSVRSMPGEDVPPDGGLFARGLWHGDKMGPASLGGGMLLPRTRLSLDFVAVGFSESGPSWTERSLALLGKLGPFRLAFLEGLLRVADWRGSAAAAEDDEWTGDGVGAGERGGVSHVG